MGESGEFQSPVFRGSFEHTVDEKGRVSIPAKFREVLVKLEDDRLIATKFILNSRRCLDVYPQVEWDLFEEELKNKPRFDETFLKLENFYFSNAQDCSLDKQGRILLPVVLREYAGLKKEVVFTGAREKFRIWDKDTWQKLNEEAEQFLTENPQSFNILSPSVH
ncbi:MAG: division/cell wall cluster transcriptional repressor MraZ [Candidatus Binatia bacterium]